ncbi:hypothetical protein M3Y95_01205800 [Aphelenchoides besseyi]|nr:hypothetical protein M3Y95_01205800 [Aphelenchoides besseyi]
MSSTVLFSFRGWWPIFLAVLLVSGPLCASAEGVCFTSDVKEVKLDAKCTNANTTIKVSNKEKALDFQLVYIGGGKLTSDAITLNVGGCEIKGDVTYGGNRNSFQLDTSASPDFPARAKATSSGVTFSNPTYNVPCGTPKFVADGDGYLVNISYTAAEELPNLQIVFSSSQIYDPPEKKVDWSTGGWRLWAVIAAVVWVSSGQQPSLTTHFSAVVLIILSIITFFVIKRCKNKKTNAKKTTDKKSTMTKSTSTKKAKKNKKKTETKVSNQNDWIENYRWPLNTFTEADKQYLRDRLQVLNPPIHELLKKHPPGVNGAKAINAWLAAHREMYRRVDDLPIEVQNQLEADDVMFVQLFDAGKELGARVPGKDES